MIAAENILVSVKSEALIKVEVVGADEENWTRPLESSNPGLTELAILAGRTLISAGASKSHLKATRRIP